jgi:hypothetical protein
LFRLDDFKTISLTLKLNGAEMFIRTGLHAAVGALLIAALGLSTPAAAAPGNSRQEPAVAGQQKNKQAKGPATKPDDSPTIRPEGARGFAYALKDVVRARSAAFCEGYGTGGDCIEEIEVCMTMLDRDQDVVRTCMTMRPQGESEDARPMTSGLRR